MWWHIHVVTYRGERWMPTANWTGSWLKWRQRFNGSFNPKRSLWKHEQNISQHAITYYLFVHNSVFEICSFFMSRAQKAFFLKPHLQLKRFPSADTGNLFFYCEFIFGLPSGARYAHYNINYDLNDWLWLFLPFSLQQHQPALPSLALQPTVSLPKQSLLQ